MANSTHISLYDSPTQMEPLWPKRELLEEKAITLLKRSQRLTGLLHPITRAGITKLLELMNSYYSNQIEGNTTRPLDIERAQKGDYAAEPKKRMLQLETTAHIDVQKEFEAKVRNNPQMPICTKEFLCDVHRAYYEQLPEEFRIVVDANGKAIPVIPGEFRTTEVTAGHHIAPTFGSLDHFIRRFEESYEPTSLSSIDRIIAAAASHHRLVWIHPFTDGNGRVARLFTHLYFIRAEIDGNGLWALSRGFARKRDEYYAALSAADSGRQNDYDGRGNLSEAGLERWSDFLFDISIDQLEYMSSQLELESLESRIREYAKFLAAKKEVDPAGEQVLVEVFFRGEVPRGEISRITGLSERSARRVTDALSTKEIIYSETKLGPWRLNVTVDASRYIFPQLFPG
jgi:Fic family protein